MHPEALSLLIIYTRPHQLKHYNFRGNVNLPGALIFNKPIIWVSQIVHWVLQNHLRLFQVGFGMLIGFFGEGVGPSNTLEGINHERLRMLFFKVRTHLVFCQCNFFDSFSLISLNLRVFKRLNYKESSPGLYQRADRIIIIISVVREFMPPLIKSQPMKVLASCHPAIQNMLLYLLRDSIQFPNDILHMLIVLLTALQLHVPKHFDPIIGKNFNSTLFCT